MILFDTDTCVEILRGNKKVIEKFANANTTVAVSFITVAELYYGAEKSNNTAKNITKIEKMLLAFEIIESSIEIEQRSGKIKANLDKKGNLIEDADIFIASTCLEKCETLITGNEKHYSRIQGLKIENWIRQ